MHLPEKMEEMFIKRLGIDAIRHVMVEKRKETEERMGYDYMYDERLDEIRDTVSEICKCLNIQKVKITIRRNNISMLL
jgi:predicted transcriptional regulator